jgi:hypothetical protein
MACRMCGRNQNMDAHIGTQFQQLNKHDWRQSPINLHPTNHASPGKTGAAAWSNNSMNTVKTNWVGGTPFAMPKKKQARKLKTHSPSWPGKATPTVTADRKVIDATEHAKSYAAEYGGKKHGRWSGLYEQFEFGKTLEIVCTRHEAQLIATSAKEWLERRKLHIRITQQRKCEDGRSRVFLIEKGNAA